jgi:ATP-binding cassette subfamily B protein
MTERLADRAEAREIAPPSRREVLAHFLPDVRKRRGKLAAGIVFAVIYAVARVIEPWPLKVVFDQVLFHKPASGLTSRPFTFLGSSAYQLLAAAALVLMATSLVRGISYYYEDFLLSSAAQEIVYGIRARLYRHLHRLPLSFHRRRSAGDTLVRLSADIVVLRDVLVDAVVNLGTGLILIVLMLAVMVAVDPVLTVVSLAAMPTIALASSYYGRRIRDNSRKQRKREGQVAAAMHEALAAIDVVQLHGATDREEERFRRLSRRSLKQGTKAVRLEAQMNRSVELMLGAGTVVILWVGSLRVLHGALTPGELIVFISYLRAAYRPLRRASKTVQRSAKALAAAERIVEVLEIEPELKDSPDAKPAPRFVGKVEFQDVEFAYSAGQPVLCGVSVRIEPGETIAIVGKTGSGKSTLVSLLPRLFDPTAGSVSIDNTDIRSFTLDSLRAQISVVQQDSVLFGLSIAENLRYGCPDADDAELQAAVAAAGLADVIRDLPEGLDTVLSERGASLSGGERHRVAIARALIRRSPILVLDEPTTGLDPAKRREVITATRDLIGATTTLLVTHDMELAQQADEILLLHGGCITARGSYHQLFTDSTDFRRLVGSQDSHRGRAARQAAHVPDVAAMADVQGGETIEHRSTETQRRGPLEASTPPAVELYGVADTRRAAATKLTEEESEREERHLVFFPHADRYLLTERQGPPPHLGSEVFLDEPTRLAYVVTKVAASPLPSDRRTCVYLEQLHGESSTRAQRMRHRAVTLAA